MPMEMTDERFDALVAEAIDAVPDELAKHMENVAVTVRDWPTPSQAAGRRGMLLGLYQGVDLTRRGPLSYSGAMPDVITIFKGPHLRISHTEDQLRTRVTKTVIHEIGHHFGISDDRLRQLGW